MASLSYISASRLVVVFALGHALPTIGHAEQLLPVADLESRTIVTALEALEESDKKVDRDAIKAEIASASCLGGDARAAANARIVNGLRTILFPAVGSVLKGHDQSRARQWCTGTLIGSQHVLTAAHCIEENLDPAAYHIFFQNAGLFAVEKLFWQEKKYSFPNADIAVSLPLFNEIKAEFDMHADLTPAKVGGDEFSSLGQRRVGRRLSRSASRGRALAMRQNNILFAALHHDA